MELSVYGCLAAAGPRGWPICDYSSNCNWDLTEALRTRDELPLRSKSELLGKRCSYSKTVTQQSSKHQQQQQQQQQQQEPMCPVLAGQWCFFQERQWSSVGHGWMQGMSVTESSSCSNNSSSFASSSSNSKATAAKTVSTAAATATM